MKHIYLNENKLSLLTEISIKDKYEKESQMGKTKLSFEDFEFLCNLDPTSKPNQVGKYANWILAKYVPNTDWNQLKRCLEWYADGIKRNIIKQLDVNTDINSFKSYEDFINVINQVSESDDAQISNSEYNNRTKLKEQFELMGSTSFYDIIKPLTYNAERYFGSHTEWCTVANKTYFDSYMEDGPLYIIYPKNGDANMKMQFHFATDSFADKNDNVWENARECIDNVVEDENIKQELWNVCKTIWIRDLLSFDELVNKLKECIAKGVEPSYLFDISYDVGYGLRAFTIKDRWNFLTKNGQLLSDQWFDEISEFDEHGLMKVGKSDKHYLFGDECTLYNLLNTDGKLLSSNQWFDEIYEFDKFGIAKIELNNEYNLTNMNGVLLSPNMWFDDISEFNEQGIAEVYSEHKFNFINIQGDILIPDMWLNDIYADENGILIVEAGEKCNFMDSNYNILSPSLWFDDIKMVENGLYEVKLDDKCNLINTYGKLLFPNQWFDEIYEVSDLYGLGEKFEVYLDDKCNYILQNGKLLSPYLWFDSIGEINDNLGVCINDEWYYVDTDKNLYSENGKFIKNLQTENVKKYQQQLIKESYKDFSITNIESIYYQINEETDEFEESYDVNAYDYDGNTIFEEYELSSFDLYRMLGETIGNKIINHEGHYNQMNNNYHLMSDDFQTYEFKDANDAAKQLFNQNLTEYYPNLHGYIMTDGECIDLGYNDHNTITRIPDINDKFEFIALGNIRCSNSTFDLIQPPTYEQKQCLRKLIANSVDLSVDIFDENGTYPLTSVMYRGKVEPSIVLGQIDRFFREGIKLNPNVDSDDDYLYENYNFEYKEDDVDMSSFEKQTSLQQDLWDSEDKLNSRARLRLLDIADDFIETLGISWIKPIDIILTGSLCNYNWSSYSDVDLHVIIDFAEINEKKDFVQEYFNAKKNEWNESHQDLKIFGFNVELFVEDIDNNSVRDGIYSLEKDKWIKKPFADKIQPLTDNKEEKIKYFASRILTKIEELENEFNLPYDEVSLDRLSRKIDKTLDTLKQIRQNGLNAKGEMSVGNIIYKICRRTGYLDKLWELKNKVYDKKNSL